MNIRRLMMVGTAGLFLIACNKKLTIDQAKKFIEENYSGKTVQEVKKIKLSQDFSQTKNEEYRKSANELCKEKCEEYEIDYKDNSLKFSYELTEGLEFEMERIAAERILEPSGLDDPIPEGQTLGITVKGKELTLTYSFEAEEEGVKASRKNVAIVNSNGQNRHLEHYYNSDGLISISTIDYTF